MTRPVEGAVARAGRRHAAALSSCHPLAPGQVRIAVCRLDWHDEPKARPVVLIRPHETRQGDPGWTVYRITGKRTHVRTGDPRIPVLDLAAAGLDGASYLAGCRPVCVPVIEIGDYLGHASTTDLLNIARQLPGVDTGRTFVHDATNARP